MLFPTGEFFVFFSFSLALVWVFRAYPLLQKLILLLLSYVFYASWDWRLLPLLVVASLSAWGYGLLLQVPVVNTQMAYDRHRLFVFIVLLYLGLLFWFKYQIFLLTQINTALIAFNLPFLLPVHDSILPLGISFYTFQMLSYVSDVYSGKEAAQRNPLDVLLYLAFFPQLIAGPILRPKEFFPQLASYRTLSEADLCRSLLLITSGLWKKIIVAQYLSSLVVEPAFQDPMKLTGLETWWALLAYGAQIYADFSAYTDFALGTALLLGFQLPTNFDRPYHAASVSEFWHRWHITLSHWLRDYLYIPLGGSRHGLAKTLRNLFVTMVLGGLWHGANVTFLFWGAIHGGILVLERLISNLGSPPRWLILFYRPMGMVITTLLVSFSWMFFKSQDLETAFVMINRLFEPGGIKLHPWAVALVGLVYVTQWIPEVFWNKMKKWSQTLTWSTALMLLILSLWFISILRPPGMAPFVYYQF